MTSIAQTIATHRDTSSVLAKAEAEVGGAGLHHRSVHSHSGVDSDSTLHKQPANITTGEVPAAPDAARDVEHLVTLTTLKSDDFPVEHAASRNLPAKAEQESFVDSIKSSQTPQRKMSEVSPEQPRTERYDSVQLNAIRSEREQKIEQELLRLQQRHTAQQEISRRNSHVEMIKSAEEMPRSPLFRKVEPPTTASSTSTVQTQLNPSPAKDDFVPLTEEQMIAADAQMPPESNMTHSTPVAQDYVVSADEPKEVHIVESVDEWREDQDKMIAADLSLDEALTNKHKSHKAKLPVAQPVLTADAVEADVNFSQFITRRNQAPGGLLALLAPVALVLALLLSALHFWPSSASHKQVSTVVKSPIHQEHERVHNVDYSGLLHPRHQHGVMHAAGDEGQSAAPFASLSRSHRHGAEVSADHGDMHMSLAEDATVLSAVDRVSLLHRLEHIDEMTVAIRQAVKRMHSQLTAEHLKSSSEQFKTEHTVHTEKDVRASA